MTTSVGRCIARASFLLLVAHVALPSSLHAAFEDFYDIDGQPHTGTEPPDTIGDIGPDYYIQAVNTPMGSQVAIFDKASGNVVKGPMLLSELGGAEGACEFGLNDPVVVYDQLASRWVLTEFVNPLAQPTPGIELGFHLCIYVSRNSDPVNGGWYVYDFKTPKFPDYPKMGVWPDAYYVTSNEQGVAAVYAFDRAKMLPGSHCPRTRFSASKPHASLAHFKNSKPSRRPIWKALDSRP